MGRSTESTSFLSAGHHPDGTVEGFGGCNGFSGGYGVNGNNVDLRKETMAAMQSTFQYQLVTRSVTDRLADLRTAAEAG